MNLKQEFPVAAVYTKQHTLKFSLASHFQTTCSILSSTHTVLFNVKMISNRDILSNFKHIENMDVYLPVNSPVFV